MQAQLDAGDEQSTINCDATAAFERRAYLAFQRWKRRCSFLIFKRRGFFRGNTVDLISSHLISSHLISSRLVSSHLTSLDVTNHQTQLVQDVLDPSTAALSFGFAFRESNHRRTTSVVSVEPYCTNSQRRVGGKRERRTQKKTHPPVSHLCGTNSSLEREKETARLPTKSARKMQARVGGWRESLGKSISPSLQLREKDPAETVLRRWRLPIVYGTTRLLGTKNTKLSSEPITVRICDSRSL